ncbi:hypothetical protein D3C71_990700 [compost metagenome]
MVSPRVKQHPLVRCQFVTLVEIEQQHLFVFKHSLGQRSHFVDFTLLVRRVGFVQIMGGVNGQFALAMAAQHNANSVDFKVVVDLSRDLAHQLVHIEAGEHRVGDSDKNAEVVTLAAQEIVIDVIADAAVDLFCHHTDNLGESVQAFVFRFAPRLIVITNKFAAAEDTTIDGQREHGVMAEGRI